MDTMRVNAYNATIMHLSSQKGSRLRGLFQEETAKGEKHFFERMSTMTASEILTLGENISPQDGTFSRRMATLRAFDAATWVYDIEKMQMLADPTSDLAQEIMSAHGRNFDDVILAALLGTAATGKDGSGTAAFDSNNQIAHGSAGFTVAKLLEGIKLLKKAEVDLDNSQIYCIINAAAEQDLLSDPLFTSRDYQSLQPLSDSGGIPKFRGIVNFIHSERVPDHTADSVYRAIMVTGDALKVARGMQPTVKISDRDDVRDQPIQIYTKQAFGAVRMEEAKVVDILFQGA